MTKSRGMSYRKRVEDIMNATAGFETPVVASDMPSLFDFIDENPEKESPDERP